MRKLEKILVAVVLLSSALVFVHCEDRYLPPSLTEFQACYDGEHDRRETGVDCGGPLCRACGAGERCDEDDDCRSEDCHDGVCRDLCTDGVLSGNETEVDCGGGICPGCEVGASCRVEEDCASWTCVAGECQPCEVGGIRCLGSWVRRCAADGLSFEDVEQCDRSAALRCDEETGGCVPVDFTPIGTTTPTGEYFQFAHFASHDTPFLGGCDVDSIGNSIFVNRGGTQVDVYSVELVDPSGDPNQHPDNPDARGPIVERRLTLVDTYDVPIGSPCSNELFVVEAGGDLGTPSIVFLGRPPGQDGCLCRYDVATGEITRIADVDADGISRGFQLLGFDSIDGRWFAGGFDRQIYSLEQDIDEWVYEFSYPDLAGSHSDGMEVVVDPLTSIPYVYVSDMTSDFIGQYRRDRDGSWVQENLFQYYQLEGDAVEGMGFGAFNHFWATSGSSLYEIGGGDIEEYVLY